MTELSQSHLIWKGPLEIIWSNTLLRAAPTWSRWFGVLSSWVLKVSKGGDALTSRQLVHFLAISNCSFYFRSLHMLLLVLPLCTCKKSLVLSSLHLSFRQLKTAIRFPFSLLQAEQQRGSLPPCEDELLTHVPFAGAGVPLSAKLSSQSAPACPVARGFSVLAAMVCICLCWTFLSVHVSNVLTIASPSPPDLVNTFMSNPTEHNFFFFTFPLDTPYVQQAACRSCKTWLLCAE